MKHITYIFAFLVSLAAAAAFMGLLAAEDGGIIPPSDGTAPKAPQPVESTFSDRKTKSCLEAEGGTKESEDAVALALKWLAANQGEDGRWTGDEAKNFEAELKKAEDKKKEETAKKDSGAKPDDKKEPPAPDPDAEKKAKKAEEAKANQIAEDREWYARYDVGLTGLSVMAFLGSGHTSKVGDYKETVKKGLAFIVKSQTADGLLGPKTSESYMYNHAIALTALAEAYGMTMENSLKEPARKAMKFVLEAQNPGFGWRYEPRAGNNDTSITGWMVTALYACREAGFTVPDDAFKGALAWFDRVTEKTFRTGYIKPGDEGQKPAKMKIKYEKFETMTAIAVHSRMLCGEKRIGENVVKGSKIIIEKMPHYNKPEFTRISYYHWFHASNALFQAGGANWKAWSRQLISALVPNQVKDGKDAGSWEPVGMWCGFGGRTYATAINALSLETFYRYKRVK
jgi:hypothetical protein